jgi:hypothetical protein
MRCEPLAALILGTEHSLKMCRVTAGSLRTALGAYMIYLDVLAILSFLGYGAIVKGISHTMSRLGAAV